MAPQAFLTRPSRWLKAIHANRATISAGPNFAYELFLTKIDDAEQGLGLSSWQLVFNGADPVSPVTIQRFIDRFAPNESRRDAIMPVYRLARICGRACISTPWPRTAAILSAAKNSCVEGWPCQPSWARRTHFVSSAAANRCPATNAPIARRRCVRSPIMPTPRFRSSSASEGLARRRRSPVAPGKLEIAIANRDPAELA
jgi:acyl-CoA synthetase (AMP-forming)/AMP-acid ligase II